MAKRKRYAVQIGNKYSSRGERQLAWTYDRKEAANYANMFDGKVVDADHFAKHWDTYLGQEHGNINGELRTGGEPKGETDEQTRKVR